MLIFQNMQDDFQDTLNTFTHTKILPLFFLNKFLFIYFYFWLPWVFVAARRLFSSCGEWGLLFFAVPGLLIGWLLLLQSMGSRRTDFSSCGTRAQ